MSKITEADTHFRTSALQKVMGILKKEIKTKIQNRKARFVLQTGWYADMNVTVCVFVRVIDVESNRAPFSSFILFPQWEFCFFRLDLIL